MTWAFTILLALVAIAGPALTATAQTTPQQRREDLRRVQELVNDPDRLMRIANFETIVAEGDLIKTQLAIRTAMTTDQAELRGLAFRSYLGAIQRLVLQVKIDPTLQQRLDRAPDKRGRDEVLQNVKGLTYLVSMGPVMEIVVSEFDFKSGRAKLVLSFNDREKVDATILGERLVWTMPHFAIPGGGIYTGFKCQVELRSNRDLQLIGTMNCGGAEFGRISLTGDMF